jgi:chromosome segregation protein
LNELDRRKATLEESIKIAEREIEEMKQEKGKNSKQELEIKKKKLEEIENLKKQFYQIKSNLSSVSSQIEDKKRQIQRQINESNFILNQIEQTEKEIRIKSSLQEHKNEIEKLVKEIESAKLKSEELENNLLEKEKILVIQKRITEESEKIKSQVSRLDICPLCKTKMTAEHVNEVISKSDKEINEANDLTKQTHEHMEKTRHELKLIKDAIAKNSIEVNERKIDIVKLYSIEDKKEQLSRNSEQIKIFESEMKNLESRKKTLESNFSKINISDEQYETLKLEINELQRSEERNLGIEITTKQRELDRIKIVIKQNTNDKGDILDNLEEIKITLKEKETIAEEKEKQAEILKRKYQKMFEEKNSIQDRVRILETNFMQLQGDKRVFESDINNFMITKAQLSARKESLQSEIAEFGSIEFYPLPIEKLREKLIEAEATLSRIGNVNMRALEVYDDIKAEYEKIKEKTEQLEKEKLEILGIIAQIDRKKRKAFLETLEKINELFSRNFSQLSVKGIVTLEPQDKKEIFSSGLDILVNVGGGKYFDVTSLSGGEQTLVALSLIFAIQEYKPYCFYIFDEIDAALDRRNSEKLSYLLRKYMKQGQYLIITHNDSIISESSNLLYGVSMQEGISKILSLKI